MECEKMPYKKTWGLPILCARTLSEKVPYKHPPGAVGIVRYRLPDADK